MKSILLQCINLVRFKVSRILMKSILLECINLVRFKVSRILMKSILLECINLVRFKVSRILMKGILLECINLVRFKVSRMVCQQTCHHSTGWLPFSIDKTSFNMMGVNLYGHAWSSHKIKLKFATNI